MFEFVSFSVKNPQKQKCGDSSFSEVIHINGEDCPVLIVADGVSRSPKDWLASKSTISFVIEYLSKTESTLPQALKQAVEYANSKIIGGVDDTFGMLTTLTILALRPSYEEMFWVNIGDSRLYGLKGRELSQISTDDTTSQPYLENGRMRLRNGQPIMVSALTKAIGYSHDLEVVVNNEPTKEFNGFLLCSDGFYSLSDYDSIAFELYWSTDYSRDSELTQRSISSRITDDASIALIGIAPDKVEMKKLLQRPNEVLKSVPPFALRDTLDKELVKAIEGGDENHLYQLLDLMNSNHLFLDRNRMIQILEMMISSQRAHQGKLVGMIKRTSLRNN